LWYVWRLGLRDCQKSKDLEYPQIQDERTQHERFPSQIIHQL
jgi:hypothetical protein